MAPGPSPSGAGRRPRDRSGGAVTLGIGCVVFFALVAIYQTWASREYQGAVQIYKKALGDEREMYKKSLDECEIFTSKTLDDHREICDRTIADLQRAYERSTDTLRRQLDAILSVMPSHRAAVARGDAGQCGAIVTQAIARVNEIGAGELERGDRTTPASHVDGPQDALPRRAK
jgi:hypothetical protein